MAARFWKPWLTLVPYSAPDMGCSGVMSRCDVKGLVFSNTVHNPWPLLSTHTRDPVVNSVAKGSVTMSADSLTRAESKVNPTPIPTIDVCVPKNT